MRLVRPRRRSVGYHHILKIQHKGIAGARFDTDIGGDAGHHQPVDTPGAQSVLDIGRAADKGAEPRLDDHFVFRLNIHTVPDIGAGMAVSQMADHRHHVIGIEITHIGRPVLGRVRIDRADPPYRAARRPNLRRQPVDIGRQPGGDRRKSRHTVLAPHILHIDHQQRRACRIDIVIGMQPAAPAAHDMVDAALRQGDCVFVSAHRHVP